MNLNRRKCICLSNNKNKVIFQMFAWDKSKREHDPALSFKWEFFWVESVILDSIREHFSVAIRSLLQAIRLINVP